MRWVILGREHKRDCVGLDSEPARAKGKKGDRKSDRGVAAESQPSIIS